MKSLKKILCFFQATRSFIESLMCKLNKAIQVVSNKLL